MCLSPLPPGKLFTIAGLCLRLNWASSRAPESAFALEFPILSPQIDAQGLKKDQADPEFLQKSDEVVILGNLFLSSCPGKKGKGAGLDLS